MSFSILYAAGAGGSGRSSELDFHMLMSLAYTGGRITVLLQDPMDASERGALERLANVHFVSLSPTLSDHRGSFAWQVAREFVSGTYDWVISRGLELSRTLAGNDALNEKMWPLLPDSELREHMDLGRSGKGYLDIILERSCGLLVQSGEMQAALEEASMRFAAKIFAVGYASETGRDSYEGTGQLMSSLLNLASAERRVVVYRLPFLTATDLSLVDDGYFGEHSGGGTHVVWVTESPQQNGPRSENCTSVRIDASVTKDDPKLVAWRLRLLVETLKCDVLICGDLDVSRFFLRHLPSAPRIWPFLKSDDVQSAREVGSVPRLVVESASTVIVRSNAERSILESHVPAVSGRVVVPSIDERGISAAIERRSVDYARYPCRAMTRRVLLASHDFKFCGEIISALQQRNDIDLRFDYWKTQNSLDGPTQESSIDWADIIFCDFASPNIGWYIRNKRAGQKLVVRMHGYELHGSWLADLDLDIVDHFVFVSELLLRSAIEKFDIPRGKTSMIPNMVDTMDLRRPKFPGSRFHLGVVGIVPVLKRPDRVLDLLELLIDVDSRYTVHVKGQHPWQYGWVWNDKDVRDSYEAFYERLATNPRLRARVGFDGFGPSMGQWFQKVGWVLSPSARESFHMGPVEGMASGAVPVVWERAGASDVFGRRWLHETTEDAAGSILRANRNEKSYDVESSLSLEHVRKFDSQIIRTEWIRLFWDV